METSPDNITKEEGLRLMKAGQFNEAIEILGQLVEREPDDPELQGYLGIAYFQKGDKLHAIRHLEESVNMLETPRMYYNLGLVYEAAYREDEAIRQYKMALALDSNYAPAQKALGKLQQTFEAARPAPSARGADSGNAGPGEYGGTNHRRGAVGSSRGSTAAA